MFIKANGIDFVSGPNKITINATRGSNQTLTWKLDIGQEHRGRELRAQFGPWNGSYRFVHPVIQFIQEPSGNASVRKRPENRKSRRLYWVGDLQRDYYIAFQLVNIQRADAGDFGVKLRVDNYGKKPLTLQNWFTLGVEVRNVSSLPFKTLKLYFVFSPRHREKLLKFKSSYFLFSTRSPWFLWLVILKFQYKPLAHLP